MPHLLPESKSSGINYEDDEGRKKGGLEKSGSGDRTSRSEMTALQSMLSLPHSPGKGHEWRGDSKNEAYDMAVEERSDHDVNDKDATGGLLSLANSAVRHRAHEGNSGSPYSNKGRPDEEGWGDEGVLPPPPGPPSGTSLAVRSSCRDEGPGPGVGKISKLSVETRASGGPGNDSKLVTPTSMDGYTGPKKIVYTSFSMENRLRACDKDKVGEGCVKSGVSVSEKSGRSELYIETQRLDEKNWRQEEYSEEGGPSPTASTPSSFCNAPSVCEEGDRMRHRSWRGEGYSPDHQQQQHIPSEQGRAYHHSHSAGCCCPQHPRGAVPYPHYSTPSHCHHPSKGNPYVPPSPYHGPPPPPHQEYPPHPHHPYPYPYHHPYPGPPRPPPPHHGESQPSPHGYYYHHALPSHPASHHAPPPYHTQHPYPPLPYRQPPHPSRTPQPPPPPQRNTSSPTNHRYPVNLPPLSAQPSSPPPPTSSPLRSRSVSTNALNNSTPTKATATDHDTSPPSSKRRRMISPVIVSSSSAPDSPPSSTHTNSHEFSTTAKTNANWRHYEMVNNGPNGEINSVAQWQQAQIMNGGFAPSANKCVPLKSPIPSKFWGDVEKTKDAYVPDFHRLVNFPDYLPKNRPPPGDGMRCCVMCGKQRLCTASASKTNTSMKPNTTNSSKSTTPSSSTAATDSSKNGPTHIIPRQNKGLCTACDVTVWVVTQNGLEIKWCKGCKNFRPWAAFGDKGLATKCVRCRDRQREKYALQKDCLKQKRQTINTSSSTITSATAVITTAQQQHQSEKSDPILNDNNDNDIIKNEDDGNEEEQREEEIDQKREMDAAHGLSNLLVAATTTTTQVEG